MANVKAFLGDGLIYGIGAAVKKFIGILLLPFYAKALSPEEYGVIDVLANLVFLFSVICTIGLNGAAGRFFYMATTEKEKGEVLFTSMSIRFTISLILALALLPFSEEISLKLFDANTQKWAVFASCLLIPISILSEEQSNIYRFYRKAIQFNIVILFQALINISIGIYLVLFLKKGVPGINVASVLSTILILIITFLFFTKSKYTFKFNKSLAKKMLRYGVPLIGVGILGWVYSVSDRYFLLHYKGLKEIGLFSIGNIFSQPLQLINTAVLMSQGVLIMSCYEDEIDENKPKTKALANRILQIYLAISVPIILFFSIFGTHIVYYITAPEYIQGALAIPYLGYSSIFTVLYVLTGYGMDLKLKTNYYFWLMLIASAINVLLNFYFIPEFGFLGAGITTLISNVLYFFMAYYYSQKFFYIKRNLLAIMLYLTLTFAISMVIPSLELQFSIQITFLPKIMIYLISLFFPFLFKIISFNDIKKLKGMVLTKKYNANEL